MITEIKIENGNFSSLKYDQNREPGRMANIYFEGKRRDKTDKYTLLAQNTAGVTDVISTAQIHFNPFYDVTDSH